MKFENFETPSSPQSQGSSIYLKLVDMETVEGVFRGEINTFKQHWLSTGRSQLCTGRGCQLCEEDAPKFRFQINFIMKENGQLVAKIFENGLRVYNALKDLHESGYDLEKTKVKIRRNGTGKDTIYTILPAKNGEVTPAVEAKLREVKLHEFSKKVEIPYDDPQDPGFSDKEISMNKDIDGEVDF